MQNVFSQSIKADDFKNLLTKNSITLQQLTTGKFKTVYGGPRKEGGLLTNMRNRTNEEYLFIYQDDDSTFQSITYYIPDYADYNKLYTSLKTDSIKVSKLGRTLYENGKKYYQLDIQCEHIEKNGK